MCITTLFGASIFNEHFICSLKLYNSHFNLWLHSVLLSLLYLHKRRFPVLSVIELTMFGASTAYRIALRIFFIDPVPVSLWECSGGSRGGSQGAMDPPFQTEPCMQNRTQSNLPEVRQSLPASTLGLSVQSSNKQSLEHLNLQA